MDRYEIAKTHNNPEYFMFEMYRVSQKTVNPSKKLYVMNQSTNLHKLHWNGNNSEK